MSAPEGLIQQWLAIPTAVEDAIRDVPAATLDVQVSPDGLTVRETVHHIAESVFIASHIILAAKARPGMVYDWSWVWPNREWQIRLGYPRVPIESSLALLQALCRHVAAFVQATEDGSQCGVQLLDSPGAALYTRTVEELLAEQVAHTQEHLGPAIAAIASASRS